MNIEELTESADEFLRKNYGMKLEIPVKINNRLKRTLGQFVWFRDSGEGSIEINGKLAKFGANRIVLDVLYHECIHYALWTKGIPHRDGCTEFEEELRKHDVSSTGQTLEFGECVHFRCDKCGETHYTDNKALLRSPERYKTACCKAKIHVLGTKVLDGTEVSE